MITQLSSRCLLLLFFFVLLNYDVSTSRLQKKKRKRKEITPIFKKSCPANKSEEYHKNKETEKKLLEDGNERNGSKK
ncbi:Protein CBG27039 [Caenorhabditis briggsae]|uniref:Protein CBG27039 n=1 Tax=Caenorhabditis briggsae TaxID=6238 RepID=B6IMA3_CAEBR|nr:Protein CBG27039 [Caenorhabditis briggsae]CAS01033.1 Protein CBG27039 [Caenorhabditis briggsae]